MASTSDMQRFYINRNSPPSDANNQQHSHLSNILGRLCCSKTAAMPSTESTPLLRSNSSSCCCRWCGRLRECFLSWQGEQRSAWRLCSLLILGLALWGVAFSLGGRVAVPFKGQLFCLGLLWVLSHIAGWLVGLVKLPPLLGMLLTGVLLRNLGVVVFTGEFVKLEAVLRTLALVIILLRAGLGLDPEALRRLSLLVARLAVIPSTVEVVTSAIMSHFLFGLPWVWSFLLGSVLAAVSPAVVIPCLFSLQSRGYGVGRGIPTLIIAAASFDDILGIAAFRIVLSIIFSTDDLLNKILEGPFSVVYGLIFGVVYGVLLRYFPSANDPYMPALRTLLLGAGCVLVMFGSNSIGYDGAGPLGCVVAAFVAGQGWRKQGWETGNNPVSVNYALLWTMFQSILFGLIGTEIQLDILKLHNVGLGIACISVALCVRLIVSVLIAAGGDLNWKERIFVAIAWFPKATVQAAIGPVALDMARQRHDLKDEPHAHIILVVAVLAILLTAPLGAVLITLLGPKLLTQQPREPEPLTDEQRQIVVNDGSGV